MDCVLLREGRCFEPATVAAALRPNSLLVSVMHANNETGVRQPIAEIAEALKGHAAFLHTDAAQTFGKVVPELQNDRIDLISVSGHKIYGPKGIGALIARRRGYERIPLAPLMFGGCQERGLRPGTLPPSSRDQIPGHPIEITDSTGHDAAPLR